MTPLLFLFALFGACGALAVGLPYLASGRWAAGAFWLGVFCVGAFFVGYAFTLGDA